MNNPRPSIVLTDASGLADFTGSALLILEITRQEIEARNVASALERLHVIAETSESALRYKESMVFLVGGYENDPRELQEIPEVRDFFARLVQEWPHWLWFLHRGVGAIVQLMAMLCHIKVHRTEGRYGTEFLDANELGAKMMDLFARGNAMFYAFGITAEEAQQSADTAVAELLG